MYFVMIERKKKLLKKNFATSVHRDINPKTS